MTNEELKAFIDAYVRNSAIEAFRDLRLNTVLNALLTGGVTDSFETYADFKEAIEENKAERNYYMRAFVKRSPAGNDRIFEYIPARNAIFWTASQEYEPLK